MATPDDPSFAELDRRVARGKRVFMLAAFGMFLFFLLSLLNFALAGRMGLRDEAHWDETVAWPFIPLPAVLVIAVAVAGVVGVFMAVPYFRHDTADDLLLMGFVSIIVFGILSLLFAAIYTTTSGVPSDFEDYPEQDLGWHWIAAVVQVPALVALAVRGAMLYRAHRRSKRDADLPAN